VRQSWPHSTTALGVLRTSTSTVATRLKGSSSLAGSQHHQTSHPNLSTIILHQNFNQQYVLVHRRESWNAFCSVEVRPFDSTPESQGSLSSTDSVYLNRRFPFGWTSVFLSSGLFMSNHLHQEIILKAVCYFTTALSACFDLSPCPQTLLHPTSGASRQPGPHPPSRHYTVSS
jgi:hypothetical protein